MGEERTIETMEKLRRGTETSSNMNMVRTVSNTCSITTGLSVCLHEATRMLIVWPCQEFVLYGTCRLTPGAFGSSSVSWPAWPSGLAGRILLGEWCENREPDASHLYCGRRHYESPNACLPCQGSESQLIVSASPPLSGYEAILVSVDAVRF